MDGWTDETIILMYGWIERRNASVNCQLSTWLIDFQTLTERSFCQVRQNEEEKEADDR